MAVKTLYQQLRIKYKLIALISAVMATVGALIVAVQQYAFEVYDEEIYAQSAKALSQTSIAIENELGRIRQQTYRIAIDESIQRSLTAIKQGGSQYDHFLIADQLRERLVQLGGLDKYVRSLQLFDYYNREYVAGRAAVTSTGQRIALLARETSGMQGGNVWVLPDDGDAALSSARLIRAYDRLSLETLGMIAVRIDMDKLLADYGAGLEQQRIGFFILQGERAVFPERPPMPPALLNTLAADSRGYDIVNWDGSRYFATRVSSDNTDWTYVTLIPYDGIFDRLADVKTLTLLLFAMLFLLAVTVTFRIAKGISGPIERLSAKMRRVQLGNFVYEEEADDRLIPMDEAGQLHRNFRIMLQRIDELIRENYVKQLAIRESEFKALQAQINPHFLYNTLETINWSSKIAGQRHISSMVESLGFLLRSSISQQEPLLAVRQELEIVAHYINIQKIRFEERLDFRMDVPEELRGFSMPKLTLQPIVENAVHYGVEQLVAPCAIRIAATDGGEHVEFAVTDNGPGMDETFLARLRRGEVKPSGSGIGLRNIDDRLKLLFGDGFGLTVESKRGEGTCVRLRIPKRAGEGERGDV